MKVKSDLIFENIYKLELFIIFMKDKKSEGKKNKFQDKIEKVYLCPKCRSSNVFKIRNFGTFFGLICKWKCNSCGFEERVFPFVDKKFSKGGKISRKNVRKKKK